MNLSASSLICMMSPPFYQYDLRLAIPCPWSSYKQGDFHMDVDPAQYRPPDIPFLRNESIFRLEWNRRIGWLWGALKDQDRARFHSSRTEIGETRIEPGQHELSAAILAQRRNELASPHKSLKAVCGIAMNVSDVDSSRIVRQTNVQGWVEVRVRRTWPFEVHPWGSLNI